MSNEKAKLMEQELTEKRKLTSDVKENISLKVFINLVLAIVVMGVFFIVNSLFVFKSKLIFQLSCRIISIIGIIGTIILFEVGYKTHRSNYAISGIELLIASIFIMFIPHLYYVIAIKYVRALIIVPIFLSCYYIIKSLFSYRLMVKQYHDSLSDVKQILEQEDESYLDEESTKIIKNQKEKEKKESKKSTADSKAKPNNTKNQTKTNANKDNKSKNKVANKSNIKKSNKKKWKVR